MTYRLGVDLGTTWTAAAIWEADKAAIFPLGQQRAAIPSVVLLRADGTVLTGEAALRRAISEPERVAREFKRRIGDTTPIIVAGTPYPAEALTARLLRSVIDQVATQQGRPPEQVVISHPANWGAYKLELLTDIARRADLDPAECAFITEPEAAAISYASRQRVGVGQNVCVFDLGGGTFDVALLQRTPVGFAILGRPDGIERLGGIDFDAAIYALVTSNLGQHYTELDPEDPLTLSAIARLRQDCVEAKEALSADTDTTIPVLLPNYQTEMRITRSEFEQLIRPPLLDTIETTRRAIASAGLETTEIHHVLLVGGSSRIPLISQLVQRELNLPTSVDADPKHAIALGAATLRLPPPQDDAGAPVLAASPPAAPLTPVAPVTPPPANPIPAPAAPVPTPLPVVGIPRGPGAPGGLPAGGGPGRAPLAPAAEIERDDPFSLPSAPRPAGGSPGGAPASTASPPPAVPQPLATPPRSAPLAAGPPAAATPPPGLAGRAAPRADGPVIDSSRTIKAPAPSDPPPRPATPAAAPKALPANPVGLTPPPGFPHPTPAANPGLVNPAPAGNPGPPPGLRSAGGQGIPAVKVPPPPPDSWRPGAGDSPPPRTPRPAPPPAVINSGGGAPSPPPGLHDPGSGAGPAPLISSKAGSLRPDQHRPTSGPLLQPLPTSDSGRAPRLSRSALLLIVLVVAIMLGVGGYLLATM